MKNLDGLQSWGWHPMPPVGGVPANIFPTEDERQGAANRVRIKRALRFALKEGLLTTTRKDLYRIADSFAATRPGERFPDLTLQWLEDVRAVADALHVTSGLDTNGNRRFDRDRFYAACGIEKATTCRTCGKVLATEEVWASPTGDNYCEEHYPRTEKGKS